MKTSHPHQLFREDNCNADLERFHGSFKSEVAYRMIFLGEDHLRRVLVEYLEYYHHGTCWSHH